MKPNCSPTARNEIGCRVKTDVEGRRLCVLSFALLCLGLLTVTSVPALVYAADFNSNWATVNDRVWVGPEYWANPMEDWRIADGRLECATGGGARNVHVLTRELGIREGNFEMSVQLGRIDQGKAKGSAGFSFAIQDEIDDYRARVFRGKGINATIAGDGTLTLGAARRKIDDMPVSVELRLSATPSSEGYRIKIHPAMENFPGDDPESDTTRMNAELSKMVAEAPEQYMWILKIFTTRPGSTSQPYDSH